LQPTKRYPLAAEPEDGEANQIADPHHHSMNWLALFVLFHLASRHAASDKQNIRKLAESTAYAHWHRIGQRSCVR
jgi:hypothetical protein